MKRKPAETRTHLFMVFHQPRPDALKHVERLGRLKELDVRTPVLFRAQGQHRVNVRLRATVWEMIENWQRRQCTFGEMKVPRRRWFSLGPVNTARDDNKNVDNKYGRIVWIRTGGRSVTASTGTKLCGDGVKTKTDHGSVGGFIRIGAEGFYSAANPVK